MTLTEALEQVDLEPGTYQCRVHGLDVELRVAPLRPSSIGALSDEDVMVDAWCELPAPKPRGRVKARAGRLPLPDRLDFPAEGDKPA